MWNLYGMLSGKLCGKPNYTGILMDTNYINGILIDSGIYPHYIIVCAIVENCIRLD
jgi:hypothetical protein